MTTLITAAKETSSEYERARHPRENPLHSFSWRTCNLLPKVLELFGQRTRDFQVSKCKIRLQTRGKMQTKVILNVAVEKA